MGNVIWGWGVVYAIGVSVYGIFLARMYFKRKN